MNEIIRRLNDAHTEWSKHLDINGSPSFGVWLLNRAESAEARAESLNNENMDLRASWRDAETNRADLYAETIETLVNEKAQAEQERDAALKSFSDTLADLKSTLTERDALRRQLEQAQQQLRQVCATANTLPKRYAAQFFFVQYSEPKEIEAQP